MYQVSPGFAPDMKLWGLLTFATSFKLLGSTLVEWETLPESPARPNR